MQMIEEGKTEQDPQSKVADLRKHIELSCSKEGAAKKGQQRRGSKEGAAEKRRVAQYNLLEYTCFEHQVILIDGSEWHLSKEQRMISPGAIPAAFLAVIITAGLWPAVAVINTHNSISQVPPLPLLKLL